MKYTITNKSRIFLALIFFISFLNSNGQIVSVSPENATPDDNNVELTFDASKGYKELLGLNDIFIHTGVITDKSTSLKDWRYTIADWNTNLSKAVAFRIGTSNLYKINIGNIRNFYNVPKEEKILRIAMKFRNSDGTKSTFEIQISVNKGTKWQEKNFTKDINCLTSDLKGNVYAATQDSDGNAYIEMWNGKIWSKLGGNSSYLYPFTKFQNQSLITAITTDKSGNVYAAGYYLNDGRPDVAKWDGTKWTSLLGSAANIGNYGIYTIAVSDNGRVYVAGGLTVWTPPNDLKFIVAEWDGSKWKELGRNSSKFNRGINKICIDPSGNLYATGDFTNEGGSSYITKWDGTTWSELGGTNTVNLNTGSTRDFVIDNSGNVYVKGYDYTYKWNGVEWTIISTPIYGSYDAVNYIDESSNIYLASLYEAPDYTNVNFDQVVKKIDGNKLSDLGGLNEPSPINGPVSSVTGDLNGNIYVAFRSSNGNSIVAKYFNNPKINSFSPVSAGKGATITIKGGNFYGVTSVSFGSDTAFSFTIVNDSTIQAVVGSGSSGDISITNPGGISTISGFTFIPAPIINSISPTKIGTNGIVTINGENFSTTTSVKFGGKPALNYSVVSNTTINATVSNGNSGYVSVTTLGGKDSLAGFTFIPAPHINSFTPISANVGETVTIIGSDFTDASAVLFGGYPAKSFTVLSAGTIQAVVDSGSTGFVSVATPGGADSLEGFTHLFVQSGIEEFAKNKIQVYPNPAQECITIESTLSLAGQNYCIYDCIGKLVVKGVLDNQTNTVSLQSLNNGIYTLEIGTKNRQVIKLVKGYRN